MSGGWLLYLDESTKTLSKRCTSLSGVKHDLNDKKLKSKWASFTKHVVCLSFDATEPDNYGELKEAG